VVRAEHCPAGSLYPGAHVVGLAFSHSEPEAKRAAQ
jgi:hypothetical protein